MIRLRRLHEAATSNVLRADILGEGRNYERKGCIAEGLRDKKTRAAPKLYSNKVFEGS